MAGVRREVTKMRIYLKIILKFLNFNHYLTMDLGTIKSDSV